MTIGTVGNRAIRHATLLLANAICLACAIGVFYLLALILAQDVALPAWVPFDLHTGGWLAGVLRLFGVLLITPPFVGLVYALFSIGADQSRAALTDAQSQYSTLRLPVGVKYTMIGLGLGLAVAIVAVLIIMQEPWGIWIFASPLVILGLYAALLFSFIRIDFDQDHIIAMTPFLKWQRHAWVDITKVTYHPDWQEMRLHFADGRRARVSTLFNGIPEFTAFLQAKTKETDHARTS